MASTLGRDDTVTFPDLSDPRSFADGVPQIDRFKVTRPDINPARDGLLALRAGQDCRGRVEISHRLLPLDFVANGLVAGDIRPFHLLLKAIRICKEQSAVEFDFDVARSSQAAVLRQPDLP